jgi:hypothetical protein
MRLSQLTVRSIKMITVLALTGFTGAPAPSQLSRFAAEKDEEGKIVNYDFAYGSVPTSDKKLEVIAYHNLGIDNDSNTLHAVMVQKDVYGNMAALAASAVNYALEYKNMEFATAAIELVGGDTSKLDLIGTGWTTMIVRSDVNGMIVDIREAGAVSFNKEDKRAVLAYDASNPNTILELDADGVSAWLDSDESLEDCSANQHLLNGSHFNDLSTMEGSYLRRGNGKQVVISDGKIDARFNFIAKGEEGQRELKFDQAQPTPRIVRAVTDQGAPSVEVIRFTGTPGELDLELERIQLADLPAETRAAIAA